jgi:hypothetical protein
MTKSNEEFYGICLPKWSALVVVGKPVTKEQAAEIIVRTDNWSLMGNDWAWAEEIGNLIGVKADDRGERNYGELTAWKRTHNVLDLHYMDNQQIYSCWIGGPHGWCQWSGAIRTSNYNIGKHPNVETVHEDLTKIAEAFPYLQMKVQLWSGETCEEDTEPVIEYSVEGGAIGLSVPSGPIDMPENDLSRQMMRFVAGSSMGRERGCKIDDLTNAVNIVRKNLGLAPLEA